MPFNESATQSATIWPRAVLKRIQKPLRPELMQSCISTVRRRWPQEHNVYSVKRQFWRFAKDHPPARFHSWVSQSSASARGRGLRLGVWARARRVRWARSTQTRKQSTHVCHFVVRSARLI